METTSRKVMKAARTQQPQRYWPLTFLVKRMSLSDDKMDEGVSERRVGTETCGQGARAGD